MESIPVDEVLAAVRGHLLEAAGDVGRVKT
jgi:hypothetical protein